MREDTFKYNNNKQGEKLWQTDLTFWRWLQRSAWKADLHPASPYKDPEYRILRAHRSMTICALSERMRLEKEFSAAELAKKCKKSVEFVQEQCDKLVNAGVIRVRYRGELPCYYYPIWVPGIMEGILSNRAQCDKYPDLGACFEEYTRIRVGYACPGSRQRR